MRMCIYIYTLHYITLHYITLHNHTYTYTFFFLMYITYSLGIPRNSLVEFTLDHPISAAWQCPGSARGTTRARCFPRVNEGTVGPWHRMIPRCPTKENTTYLMTCLS